MTTPRVAPQPLIPPYELHAPTWCRTCQIHRATVVQPECPVCLDDKKREAEQ